MARTGCAAWARSVCALEWEARLCLPLPGACAGASGAAGTLVSWPHHALSAPSEPLEAHLRITSIDPASGLIGYTRHAADREPQRAAVRARRARRGLGGGGGRGRGGSVAVAVAAADCQDEHSPRSGA